MNAALRFRPEAERFLNVAADLLRAQLQDGALVGLPNENVVAARVKSPEAIVDKIKRRGLREDEAISSINDFIGLRILVLHIDYMPIAVEAAQAWAQRLALTATSRDDRFARPSLGGYRAIHLGFELAEANEWNLPKGASVEVQITTWLQHFHGMISHRKLYKPAGTAAPEVANYLVELGHRLVEIDGNVSRLTGEPGSAAKPGEGESND